MDNDYSYKYKIYCELIITSKNITPTEISEKTNLESYRAYTVGDIIKSKHSGTEGKRATNLWAIKSDTTVTEVEDVTTHINYFRSKFVNKTDIFKQLKKDEGNEISFWIWIEADEVGVGIEIPEKDLMFINEISNRLHFTFLPTKN